MSTMDAEVLIAIPVKSSLDPAFSPLTEEALYEAEIAEVEGVPLRVVRASHLGVIALSTGRPKDYARILSLLESGSVSRDDFRQLADRHGLSAAWQRSLRGNASDPSPVQGGGQPPEKKPPR